jgi:ParB family chromosome partitioning protein
MRHDEHYVDALAASAGTPIGRLVPIELIDPNPNQPRQVMGDLSELISSITEKGIIEPLVVRQRGDRFQIIAGERRYQASVQAGLRELPVVIREVDDTEVIELALIENLQRKDLTPFEEAEAMHGLADRCGYTHEDLARRLGKSRTSVTESLALAGMPDEVRNLCRLADISSKSLLLQIVRQETPEKMTALVEKIASQAARPGSRFNNGRRRPGVHMCSRSVPHQAVQPQDQLHQGPREPRRNYRRARGHPARAQKSEIDRASGFGLRPAGSRDC